MNQTPLKDAMNSSCESVSIVLTKKHDGGLPMKKLILYSSSKNRVDAFSHYSNREIRMTVLLGCHEGSLPPPIVRNQGTISHIEPSSMDGDKCPSSLSRNKNLFRVASTNCGDGANERQVVVAPWWNKNIFEFYQWRCLFIALIKLLYNASSLANKINQ